MAKRETVWEICMAASLMLLRSRFQHALTQDPHTGRACVAMVIEHRHRNPQSRKEEADSLFADFKLSIARARARRTNGSIAAFIKITETDTYT